MLRYCVLLVLVALIGPQEALADEVNTSAVPTAYVSRSGAIMKMTLHPQHPLLIDIPRNATYESPTPWLLVTPKGPRLLVRVDPNYGEAARIGATARLYIYIGKTTISVRIALGRDANEHLRLALCRIKSAECERSSPTPGQRSESSTKAIAKAEPTKPPWWDFLTTNDVHQATTDIEYCVRAQYRNSNTQVMTCALDRMACEDTRSYWKQGERYSFVTKCEFSPQNSHQPIRADARL